jgi:MFS family permease
MRTGTGFAAVRNVLANRDFLLFTCGNSVSFLGVWVQRIAVGWLTWQLTESPAWLGIMAFADLAPSVVLAPLFGALADRVNRLRAIKWAQVLGAMQGTVLALLVWTDTITIGLLVWLTFALGMVMAFNQPLRLATFPEMVARKDISVAVTLNSLTFNISRIAGPALAGITIRFLGLAPCFALVALADLAFIVALFFVRWRQPRRGGPPMPLANIPVEIMDGIRYSVRHQGIGPVMVVMMVVAVFGRAYVELLPGFAAAVFDSGAEGLAVLTGSLGVGAIVGGLVMAMRSSVAGLTVRVVNAALFFGVTVFGFAFAPNLWAGMVLIGLSGYASVIIGVGEQSLVQSAVDGAVRGRVMSLYGMIARAGPAFGALAMGAAAEVVGLRWPVAIGACALLALWLWLRPRRQRMAAALEGEPGGRDG